MPLSAFVIKKPYEISFTGNPMPFNISLTPYTSVELAQNIRIIVRILIETSYGSGIFTEIKSQSYFPNNKGQVIFDVANVVDAYLEYFIPPPTLQKPLQAVNQRKRYRVDYLLLKDDVILGTVVEGTILNAIKGGMAYDQWHPTEFFSKQVLVEKKPLQFHPQRRIAFNEHRYFFWIYPLADLDDQTVTIKINLNDATVVSYDLPDTIFTNKWGVCCIPAGFNQLNLPAQVPVGKIAVSYSIEVNNTTPEVIVAPVTYQLEHKNSYAPVQLFYRNSAGGIETINLRGQVDFEGDYARNNIQSAVPPAYFANQVLLHQTNDINTGETPRFKGDTGFLTREATDRLRDFFLSPQKFEVVPGDAAFKTTLLPITVITKNTKFFSNDENLVTTLVEWQRAYSNDFYTPNRLMGNLRTCPAMEYLNVVQVNKNLLRIMWAMENPYDRVEINIVTTLGTQVILLSGNSGSVTVPFNNPVLGTLDTEEIEIKARTICDEFSTPMDVGPFTSVLLVVVGNSLPIANDDYYSIMIGYNTGIVLPGSVLANDYDPDGDPIECVVQTAQVSNDAGTYDIDAAGIITYQPPSSVYAGTDYFDYEIQEVGSIITVTGRVYITVGTSAGVVYGRIVLRNQVTSASGYTTQTSAEVWIDFFSDPAATNPLNLNGTSITFNVNKHTHYQFGDCSTDDDDDAVPTIGAGIKVKLYEGIIYSATYDPGFPCDDVTQIVYTLLAGTGYVAI